MFEQLRKQSRKSTRNRLLICLLIVGVVAIVTGKSVTKLIEKPQKLDDLAIEQLSGAYVNGDINAIIGNFAEYYEENEDGSEKNVTDNYYVIPVGEEEFIGLQVAKQDFDGADQIYNETMDYLMGDKSELTTSMNVTGTINDMEGEVYDYYVDWFESCGYTQEEINKLALPYILQIGYVGDLDSFTTYGLLIVGVVSLLLALIIIIQAITGAYLSRIKKYIKQNETSIDMERIEVDYEGAEELGSVRIGKLFTYYFQGNKAWLLKNADIVWAYLYNVTHKTYGIKVGVTRTLIVYTKDKKKHSIQVKKSDDITAILNKLPEVNPQMVAGYSDELMKLFKKDFDAFSNLYYNRETASTSQDDINNRF